MNFDPDAAATGDSIFGLPFTREDSRIVVIPVPFDATTSYTAGTSEAPAAIMAASRQVDLRDPTFGPLWKQGIFMEPINASIAELSARTRRIAAPIIDKGGAWPQDADDVARIDAAGEALRRFTRERAEAALGESKIPVILGGDHSTPLGAIEAVAERHGPIGVLQIDAHMDFRRAYEGFRYSHASIMLNVLENVPGVERLVQVGIRDFGERELEYAEANADRVRVYADDRIAQAQAAGQGFDTICNAIAADLPDRIYISFDIDGLEPSLCPHTGTPVPGGITFRELSRLLMILAQAGKRLVGFDLVEVCPGPEGEWDANVGARVLYKLCGLAGASRK